MKWCSLLLIQVTLVSAAVHHSQQNNKNRQQQYKRRQLRQQQREHDITYNEENNKEFQDKFMLDLEAESEELPLYRRENAEMDVQPLQSPPMIEIDMNAKCPQGCVCQYAHFKDLPISRWINYMIQRPHEHIIATGDDWSANNNVMDDLLHDTTDMEDLLNEHDSAYDGDLSYLTNPYVKQATCIIQDDTNLSHLIDDLPHDIQALILLYTGVGKNKSVNASVLKPLNQLTTLEVRGSEQGSVRFILDVPLAFIQHANFEFITLMGTDAFKRPPNMVHPKEVFNYKPNIELVNGANIAMDTIAINPVDEQSNQEEQFQYYEEKLLDQEDLDIVPYEIYREEVKKARMPTFYGWQHLEVLRIHSCGFHELSWEMFLDLTHLQHLSLDRNDIKEVPPFALSGATQLQTLSLAHNAIKDLHYRDLAGLFKLRLLDLSDNRLSKLTELSFPPLPQLRWIDFRHNPIRYIFPATFWVMNNTQVMWFGSKEVALELWGNMPFKMLHQLKLLHIGNVSIGSLDNNIFKDLAALQILQLHGDVRSLEFDAFSTLHQLRHLDMSHCHLREISMDALMGCKQLRMINFSYNNLIFIPPGVFDDQAAVEEIYLDGNQLITLPRNFFLQRKLKLARLNNNPWKCSCDMMNWKAKITNQERGPSTERCINDYLTGKRLSCRKLDGFKFNRKYAPRCNNFKGRSVYYVLRKQLSCGPPRIMYLNNSRNHADTILPHWRKLQNHYPNEANYSNSVHNRVLWQLKRGEKVRNSLRKTSTSTSTSSSSSNNNNNKFLNHPLKWNQNDAAAVKVERVGEMSNDI